MDIKSITNLITTAQGASLVSHNLRSLKKKKKNMLKMGVDNIVGVNLIKATAQAGSY